jgi:23S rRNA pseudouridine1911/1915/1917 synthase
MSAASFKVDAASAGTRLDAFIARRLGIAAAAARRLIAGGAVRVDGRRAAKGARLDAGSVVGVAADGTRGGEGPRVVPAPELALTVLYEDPHLVAVDKPAGMPSHPLHAGERGTAANAIVARYPECAAAARDPREGGLGHRLDTATSGVLLAARTRAAWEALRRALAAPGCEKRYLAEVWGTPPPHGTATAPIGRRGRRTGRVRVGGGRQMQSAETEWTVVATRGATTLLEVRLHAGRRHQVRAHLAAAGYPIVGDDRYGGSAAAPAAPAAPGAPGSSGAPAAPAASGLRLHAAEVRLAHPVTGAALTIRAPAPAWVAPFLPASA